LVADVVDGPLGADASETGNRQRGGHRLDFIGAEHALAGVELPGASVDAAADLAVELVGPDLFPGSVRARLKVSS